MMPYDDAFTSIGESALNLFDDLQKVAEGTTSVRTKGNQNSDIVEVVRSTRAMLGNVNAYNRMLDSIFNAQLRDFNITCWLEHREVRHCKDNGLSILTTSHTSPTNFLPLFETIASTVSEVSIGVCEMAKVESKLNNLKQNNGGVVERGEELEESEVERDPNGSYSLGPKISDWDKQQREWLNKNPRFPNFLPNGWTCNSLFTGSAPKA
ncbi:hypothetical protein SUGI_0969050 [Cryptomeria japonica]|nr:hypothetical protein SUGI_0969050 [Cryptomeria japonica]